MNSQSLQLLRDFTEAANGMLPSEVYEECFYTSASLKPRLIVEIGTAHGAATIALGLGAKSHSEDFIIKTVDRLGGRFSSRSAYGSPEANRDIILSNFRRAGISDNVQLFVGNPDEFSAQINSDEKIDILMLDADGRIDRDLINFYSRLAVDAPIIIDDVDSDIWLSRNHEGVTYIDNKHRLTALLLDGFCSAGFIRVDKRIANTAFCRTTNKPYDSQAFISIALTAYRSLVITEVSNHYWDELAEWSARRADVREAISIHRRIPQQMRRLMHRTWPMLRRLT